eukprot:TRINITY_DN5077_c0_g2_i1.p1 TRINITY_DN5077_c0_g2~~TRINITY_DN5077_c0_g2_i1.p1  ORF type:complete len:321 (+),score=58.58 TRINITY_DN5077_c0_g2_i1:50-1012(+)
MIPIAVYQCPVIPGFSGYLGYQYPPCDPRADAHALHKAFKGLGTDEKTVINILSNRSKEQLDAINREYKAQSSSHHDLEHALKHEISGDFLNLALLVVTPTIIIKKDTLREAVKGLGTRESSLIDVLTQSYPAELAEIARDSKLKDAVLDDVSGDFKKLIEELLQARRPQYGQITQQQAQELAHEFHKCGEGRLGTNDRELIRLVCSNSVEALHQVNHEYKSKHGHGLAKAITSETSGDFRDMLLALLMPKHEYFAARIHSSVKGLGTNERLLNYCFSVLDKGDMKWVAEAYKEMYKKTLKEDIVDDTSGHYRELLVALM